MRKNMTKEDYDDILKKSNTLIASRSQDRNCDSKFNIKFTSREKKINSTRIHRSCPDKRPFELLEDGYHNELDRLEKDSPYVVYPSGHPLLLAKIRVLVQSFLANAFTRRLHSFLLGDNPNLVSWPDDAIVRPLPLVLSGFSYDGNGKEVVCRDCGFRTNTDYWVDNDEKYGMTIHRKGAAFCPFMETFINSEIDIIENEDITDLDSSQDYSVNFLSCPLDTISGGIYTIIDSKIYISDDFETISLQLWEGSLKSLYIYIKIIDCLCFGNIIWCNFWISDTKRLSKVRYHNALNKHLYRKKYVIHINHYMVRMLKHYQYIVNSFHNFFCI